jgi:hypothetical protein
VTSNDSEIARAAEIICRRERLRPDGRSESSNVRGKKPELDKIRLLKIRRLKPLLPTPIDVVRRLIKLSEKPHPGFPKIRRSLESITKAAAKIQRELADPYIWLPLRERGDIADHEMRVHDLAVLAEDAAKGIPRGQGRRKHYDFPFSPHVGCALIVGTAWSQVNGKWPDNEDARTACNILWGVAGGDVKRRGGEGLDVWREHLRDAKEHRGSTHSKVILLSLTDGWERKTSRSTKERIAARFGEEAKPQKNTK